MTTPDQVIAKIREALEAGPTPGEWASYSLPASNTMGPSVGKIMGPSEVYRDRSMWLRPQDAEYIAAVNPQNIAVLLAALDAKDAETRCIVADVAKDFRAVNVDAVLSQMGDVVPILLARAEAAEAERDALRKASPLIWTTEESLQRIASGQTHAGMICASPPEEGEAVALYRCPPPQSRVRPLEWRPYPEDGGRMFEGQNQQRRYVSRALPPWGSAIFIMEKDGVFTLEGSCEVIHDTEQAAQIAAQAEFDAWILSALAATATEGGR